MFRCAPPLYDERMRDSNGNERDLWVMVDHNGEQTLFKLVEVGNRGDGLRLARELHAPTVVVDMALPAYPALDEMRGKRRRSGSSRLILVNLRTSWSAEAGKASL